MFFNRVGFCLTNRHQTWLESLAMGKHSSLFRTFVNYGRKKSRGHIHNTYFLRSLQMDRISQTVCHWQAFPAQCYQMRQLVGPIRKQSFDYVPSSQVPMQASSLQTPSSVSPLQMLRWGMACGVRPVGSGLWGRGCGVGAVGSGLQGSLPAGLARCDSYKPFALLRCHTQAEVKARVFVSVELLQASLMLVGQWRAY